MKLALSVIFYVLASLPTTTVMQADTDSSAIYKDRKDTLSASAVVGAPAGNYLSKFKDIRTEVISASGLCKMACCNLAESFENSASVTVGYSDAVTGARQIRLLGMSGIYTQMLDENRPVMRGIASPFGLGYVPGQWLNSIQIAKGSPSVLNGVESITGQINMEHRKPTDEIPFFANFSFMSDTKADLNLASSLQLGKDGKWSTVILGHVSGNFVAMDHNKDGFVDEPKQFQLNLANRWLYFDPDGTQVRFGVRFLRDQRNGGQIGTDTGTYPQWLSNIVNQSFNAYIKTGFPLNADNSRNVALVGDFNDYMMQSSFGKNRFDTSAAFRGCTTFDATQISGFLNLLYQDQYFENHHFTLGLSALYDHFDEHFNREVAYMSWKTAYPKTDIVDLGVFGEYTYKYEDKISVIAGLRGDWYNNDGFRISPRITARYTPIEQIVLRLNGGRGLRHSSPLTDNIGVMSTGKEYYSEHKYVSSSMLSPLFGTHPLEDSWIVGGNLTYYLPFGVGKDKTYLSFDYFRTQFVKQLIVDYDVFNSRYAIDFYMLSGQSYTNTYQVDFAVEPLKRFTINATFRYTDSKVSLASQGLVERPMTSRYKGVLNLQYATNLNKWIFDLTLSVNGPCTVYKFLSDAYPDLYPNGQSPVYPLLYAQITHKMKGWDIYIGGENLTNFKQQNPILVKYSPYQCSFDASGIWGPLMGIKGYIGVRITLWKKG